MVDDDKKSRPRKPRAPGENRGGDRPFRKQEGGKPFRKPEGGKPAYKPRRQASTDVHGADRPKRAWKPRDGSGAGGDAKPFRKREDGKPFRKPEGGKPAYKPRRDEATPTGEGGGAKRNWRPRTEGGSGDRKPYRERRPDDRASGASGERKPYGKPGGKKPFRQEGGERPFRPRRDDRAAAAEGAAAPKREWKPRAEGAEGRDKPFRQRPRETRPERRQDGDRPFRKREESARPRPADRGDKPFAKRRDDDRKPSGAKPRGDAGPQARDDAAPEEGERIAKRLARAGISSRRDAEAMIAAGRIRVNGQVLTSPAVNVTARDTILVDNQPLPAIERTRLFLFHKPAGVVTTNRDPEGRRTVFDVLPEGLPRLVTIGRLDINTEGLLLLTNDGGLARVLELPATGWLRRYRARVHGKVDEKALVALKDGIAVDGVFYGAIEAALDREQGSNAWMTLGLREGKNREVKNVLGALGLDVSRLIRISYGPFQLGELAEGAVQELKGRMLRDQLGERLIEEAGADFEAPVAAEFPNRPVTRRDEPPARPERPRYEEPGEGGLVRNRKRERENRREDALGRLQTRPAGRIAKPAGGKKERAEKPFEPPRSRSSNVWMAPGARPRGKKADDEPSPSPRSREDKSEGQRPPRRDGAGFDGRPNKGERGSRVPPARPTDPNKRGGGKGGTGPRKPPRKDR